MRAEIDMQERPLLREALTPYLAYWSDAVTVIAGAWRPTSVSSRNLRAAIRLATSFQTWRTLAREMDFTDAGAADLMAALIGCRGKVTS